MTNQEILTKAIEKAIAGGWLLDTGEVPMRNKEGFPHTPNDVFAYYGAYSMPKWNMIIFNHNFAKALWPGHTSVTNYQHFEKAEFPRWIYHLQQMVIAGDPIEYLGANV